MSIVAMIPAVAGNVAVAAEYNKLITNITDLDSRLIIVEGNTGGIGVVGVHRPTAGVTGSGTTEKVGCFLTFNATAGRRYKATWTASLSSSTANTNSNLTTNPVLTRLRWKAGSDGTAVDGAMFDARDFAGLSNGYNLPVNLIGDWRALVTQQVTIAATFQPTSVAAGNVTQAYNVTNHTPKLIIEDIGAI